MLADSRQYEAFAAVVEAQSISVAARQLDVPRPTLSRRLKQLEAVLGVQLLHRSTRQVLPTPSGERLYARIRPLLDDLGAAEQTVLDEAAEPRGRLRVSVPPLLAPALDELCALLHARYPQLTIELVAALRFVDLRAEGFEVALRGGRLRDPDLICRQLLVSRVGAVASPAYLADAPSLQTAGDLAEHALLLGHTEDGRPRRWWPTWDGGRVRVSGRFITDDRQLLKAMALQGRGIALLSAHNCAEAIVDGRLAWVLPKDIGTTLTLYVVYAQREVLPPRVRVFVDAAIRRFAEPSAASMAPAR